MKPGNRQVGVVKKRRALKCERENYEVSCRGIHHLARPGLCSNEEKKRDKRFEKVLEGRGKELRPL